MEFAADTVTVLIPYHSVETRLELEESFIPLMKLLLDLVPPSLISRPQVSSGASMVSPTNMKNTLAEHGL